MMNKIITFMMLLPLVFMIGCVVEHAENLGEEISQENNDVLDTYQIKEEYFQSLALSSQELTAFEQRLENERPDMIVDRSAGYTVVDNLFEDGDLIGVYFPVQGINDHGFVSLWYNQNSNEIVHTVIGTYILDDKQTILEIELDGYLESEIIFTEENDFDMEGMQKSWVQLGRCLSLSGKSVSSWKSFCRSIPHAAARAGCWAVTYGTAAVRAGWCYAVSL